MPNDPVRVLVADDSEEIRDLLEYWFKNSGARCDLARDGVAAENQMSIYKHDLVVTDLAMPKKHGHRLVMDILAKPNPPVIVVVTGLMEPKLITDLIQRGVDDVVLKPVYPELFVTKALALVKRRRAQAVMAATTGPGGSSPDAVARQIQSASAALQQQLQQVTETFQHTISGLERQQKDLEANYMGSIRLFSGLLGKIGSTGSSHASRVERICQALGERLSLNDEQLKHLKFAALLHDIGQFGMPDDVRGVPPWQLQPEQRQVYELYPELGATLLSEISGMEEAATIIDSHCENYDGTGFPRKLAGTAIPLSGRILRLADGCDLLYMQHKMVHPIDVLRNHLLEESGKDYDPNLVDHALALLPEVYKQIAENAVPVHPSALNSTHILAEDVYDASGHFLARTGAQVTDKLAERLVRLVGDQLVHVQPPRSAS